MRKFKWQTMRILTDKTRPMKQDTSRLEWVKVGYEHSEWSHITSKGQGEET